MSRKMMTSGEVARMLGVGVNTVKRWILGGELRAIRTPGGHWRIPEGELDAFMHEQGMHIPARGKATPARVLIIDDDPAVCTLLEAILEHAGFPTDVKSACDGYAGLVQLGAWRPDVLVLDILMPKMNGLEVLRRLSEDDSLSLGGMGIVVVTSAFDQPAVVDAVREAGVVALLPKPVDKSRFLDAVAACLTPGHEP